MAEPGIDFNDSGADEWTLGALSRLTRNVFLDWLAPASVLRWIDVACGSSAFSKLFVQRCARVEAKGLDPSEAQLGIARSAKFLKGDAVVPPIAARSFDADALDAYVNPKIVLQ